MTHDAREYDEIMTRDGPYAYLHYIHEFASFLPTPCRRAITPPLLFIRLAAMFHFTAT